ncbi:MAG: hypothetical protein FWD67_04030 [Betaproteobacteria bacterium]|nr:hypothetical protein [Betaproteobacteria bacterium]
MRKAIAVVILLIGLSAGFLSAVKDGWGTRVVMMCIGLMFTAPVAGFVAFFGKKQRFQDSYEIDQIMEQDPLLSDKASLLWLKDGHYPYTKPSHDEPDLHQFEPQNQAWPHN